MGVAETIDNSVSVKFSTEQLFPFFVTYTKLYAPLVVQTGVQGASVLFAS